MRLSELAAVMDGHRLSGADVEVSGVEYDSKTVKPGDLFVAIPGFRFDGHTFAAEAVGRGAVALVGEREFGDLELPQLLVGDSRAALAALAATYYGHPTHQFKLVGITGTNGKTTTSFLVESIFRAGGMKAGLMGTVESHIGDEVLPVVRTTPEASDLQKNFRRMADEGVEAAVIEVSSHALDLHRVDGCRFDVAVFTNLSRDHLDYHATVDNYFEAKNRLFDFDGVRGVINVDDEYGRRIAGKMGPRAIRYSAGRWGQGQPAEISKTDIYAEDISLGPEGSIFRLHTPDGSSTVRINLPGAFNVANALSAAGSGVALGIPLEAIANGLAGLKGVPGRFERVHAGLDCTVIVDYAHTPDGLEKLLDAAREITEGKLISVFGCGGDRDRAKRPLMGEISARLADKTIVTSDNPRRENPNLIIDEIEAGVRNVENADYEIVVDRREAITRALSLAGRGDVVIVAGKGHETGQVFADRTVDFDDRLVIAEIARGGG